MIGSGRKWAAGILAPGLLFSVTSLTFGEQSSSRNYVLHQSTLNTAGTASQGIGYRLSASLGQQSPVGASASAFAQYIVQSGFWSFGGSGFVPVLLTINHNPAHSGNVDLSWTSNNAPYRIYQSANCLGVFSALFTSTSNNNLDDISPPPGSLVCYNVLSTAPGP